MILLPTKKNHHHYWHNNNNGNFICVFDCTIVNLATYRQFTNAAWDWIIKKTNNNNNNDNSRVHACPIISMSVHCMHANQNDNKKNLNGLDKRMYHTCR